MADAMREALELQKIVHGHQNSQGLGKRPRGSHAIWVVRNEVAWEVRDRLDGLVRALAASEPSATYQSAINSGEVDSSEPSADVRERVTCIFIDFGHDESQWQHGIGDRPDPFAYADRVLRLAHTGGAEPQRALDAARLVDIARYLDETGRGMSPASHDLREIAKRLL